MINVVTADVMASNGVIHVIDKVILPLPTPPLGDVVEVAIENGNFKTLVEILTEIDAEKPIISRLKDIDAVTIFAPSDEAFAKLPEGLLDTLTLEDKKKIVFRHIIWRSTVPAANVTTGPVRTLGREYIDLIKTDDGGVQISYEGR